MPTELRGICSHVAKSSNMDQGVARWQITCIACITASQPCRKRNNQKFPKLKEDSSELFDIFIKRPPMGVKLLAVKLLLYSF